MASITLCRNEGARLGVVVDSIDRAYDGESDEISCGLSREN